MRILIADDYPMFRRILAEMLRDDGQEVDEVGVGSVPGCDANLLRTSANRFAAGNCQCTDSRGHGFERDVRVVGAMQIDVGDKSIPSPS